MVGAQSDSYRFIAQRYRLESEIGRGAMGTVWAGADEVLHRRVAVKEMKLAPDLPRDEAAELRERALREARAMARISHPNVVTVYDVAWQSDTPFLVMELVAGQNLTTTLGRHGPLNHELLALVIDGIAAALQAAHRLGIVHRDVKPGNVMVTEQGEIKLSDFGIARNSADPTLTRSGYLMGTPAYVAPEVALGKPVTASADLWSLGATLFLAAEGRRPYDGTDPLVVLGAIIHGDVPRHDSTGPIGAAISGLMVKEPADRISLDEVRRLVRPLLPEPGGNPFVNLSVRPSEGPLDRSASVAVPTAALERTTAEAPTPQRGAGGSDSSVAPAPDAGRVWRPAGPTVITTGVVAVLAVLVAAVAVFGNLGDSGAKKQDPVSGVPPDSLDAFSIIECEDYSRAYPGVVRTSVLKDDVSGEDIGAVGPTGYPLTLLYENVDFGPAPPTMFYAFYKSLAGDPNAILELRLDDPQSPPIATISLDDTGEASMMGKTAAMAPVTGTHDVYLTIEADDKTPGLPTGTKDNVYLDSIYFEL